MDTFPKNHLILLNGNIEAEKKANEVPSADLHDLGSPAVTNEPSSPLPPPRSSDVDSIEGRKRKKPNLLFNGSSSWLGRWRRRVDGILLEVMGK